MCGLLLAACSGGDDEAKETDFPETDLPDTDISTEETDLPTEETDTDTTPTETAPCPPVTGIRRRISGSTELATAAWAQIDGPRDAQFGFGVAGVGDITGDGGDDLVIRTLHEEVGSDKGSAYLMSSPLFPGKMEAKQAGTRYLDDDPGVGVDYWIGTTFTGIQRVADQNGDGFPELLLSVPALERSHSFLGRGEVYLLQSPVPAPVGQSITLDAAYTRIHGEFVEDFGYSMAVSDLDLDGDDDLVVSAPLGSYDDGYIRGRVFVYEGPLPPGEFCEEDASWAILGDNVGSPVGGGPVVMGDQVVAGDLTADGVPDIVVTSSASWVDGVELTGEAYVFDGPFDGGALFTSGATGVLQGGFTQDFLGLYAAYLGDTDGDGYGEFGLGSQGGMNFVGHTDLYNGPISGTHDAVERADTHLYGLQDGDYAAFVASAGDLDEDGLDDVAVGAWQVGGDARGATMVFYGAVPRGSYGIDEVADAILWGSGFGDWPNTPAAAGDVDGDCMPDLAVGERKADAVYLLRGGTF